MNKMTITKSVFVTLCLIGMLILPAAAAQTGQAATVKGSAIDQGLKDDLWANYQQYRLQRFDLNVEQATGVITILEQYGIDTTACQNTLSTISSKRSDLETALSAQDRAKLKTVNAELRTLWKQFFKDVRDALSEHYGGRAAGRGLSGMAGMTAAEDAGF
ncbi:MAG: hypothetical protein LUQ19_04225 [Methanoregula sp.]|nr:hypothetical protein [Methanoregula sp.]